MRSRLRLVWETGDCTHQGGSNGHFRAARRRVTITSVFARHGPDDIVHSGLRELVVVRAALDRLEAALVLEGRRRGYRWADLGADLGLSLYGVRRRHLAIDPIYAWKQSRPPAPGEELRQLLADGDGKIAG